MEEIIHSFLLSLVKTLRAESSDCLKVRCRASVEYLKEIGVKLELVIIINVHFQIARVRTVF